MKVIGKAAFLTGGARGIGRALSEALLKKGAKVFFCDINATTGKVTEAELQKQYGTDNVIFAQCDVSVADQLTGVFKKAVDTLGAVDICVNHAGFVNELLWEKMIAVNMVGVIRGSLLALEHMRRDSGGRGGVIINTSSIGGLLSIYHEPVYSATKHAIIGFTESWAANPRMKELGVRWGTLCPGAVDTKPDGMVKEGQIIDVDKLIAKFCRNMIQPEQVAEAFMTLVEDDDSNGAILTVPPFRGGTPVKKRQLVDSDGVSNPFMADFIGFVANLQ